MWESKVDMRSRKEMTKFLMNHFRYNTMNSWNQLTSYANNVKLNKLDIPRELDDKAWDLICGDVDLQEFWWQVDDLIADFRMETGYTAGFNGRSSGYIVLYDTKQEIDEHKSYCPLCGQQNFQIATETNKRCGKCGKDSRINFPKPRYRWITLSHSIDDFDEEDFAEYDMEWLRERVKLVQRFDRLCDDIRSAFIYMLENYDVVEEEYTVTKTRKILQEAMA